MKYCLVCNQKLVNIVYGFPGDKSLFRAEERQEIYLSGCMPNDAKYHCYNCDADFYWDLVIVNKDSNLLNIEHLNIKQINSSEAVRMKAAKKQNSMKLCRA